jgi:hypothetical protein
VKTSTVIGCLDRMKLRDSFLSNTGFFRLSEFSKTNLYHSQGAVQAGRHPADVF